LSCGCEEIGIPRIPVVADGCGAAVCLQADRAWTLAVEIIYNMDHNSGMFLRGVSGYLAKRPFVRAIAVLNALPFYPAARVANDHNSRRVRRGKRQLFAIQYNGPRLGWDRRLAHEPKPLRYRFA
jgi:hypothetical protein